VEDPNVAAKLLVDHALAKFSTDNLSCMVVRFDKSPLLDSPNKVRTPTGVETHSAGGSVGQTAEGDTPTFTPSVIKGSLAEEEASAGEDMDEDATPTAPGGSGPSKMEVDSAADGNQKKSVAHGS
jgi:protein phosphatase PTC1